MMTDIPIYWTVQKAAIQTNETSKAEISILQKM